jgi:hypothetical protein
LCLLLFFFWDVFVDLFFTGWNWNKKNGGKKIRFYL